jgi:glycosyltransferase involved in cell wall biosynthesis
MRASSGDPPRYSVVIPVYNSESLVGETIDRTRAVFEARGLTVEVIVVNDGSTDGSWDVLRDKAMASPDVLAVNLLRNYGQHAAIFCGLAHSRGQWVVTLDDDLQNPPEEVVHLIDAANRGHDVVCGRFRQKQHSGYRRIGSKIVAAIDRHVFHKPKGLALTNFRIMRRDVVDRMLAYPTSYPYIRGLMLICSTSPTDVWVEHRPRPGGGTSYSVGKLVTFVLRIVFNYSTLPARAVIACGVALLVLGLMSAVYLAARSLTSGPEANPWVWVLIGMALVDGLTLAAIGIVAEYVVALSRLGRPAYLVQEIAAAERMSPAGSVSTRH